MRYMEITGFGLYSSAFVGQTLSSVNLLFSYYHVHRKTGVHGRQPFEQQQRPGRRVGGIEKLGAHFAHLAGDSRRERIIVRVGHVARRNAGLLQGPFQALEGQPRVLLLIAEGNLRRP